MNNYSDPMITYDEIVEALRAILSCTKVNDLTEEYGILNVKYDSVKQTSIQKEQEQALIQALQSLEKTIENANKVIREALEQEIERINSIKCIKLESLYSHSNVKRKLAAQLDLVNKLKNASLSIDVLNEIEEYSSDLPDGLEEINEDIEDDNDDIIIQERVVEESIPTKDNRIVMSNVINRINTRIKEDSSTEQNMKKMDINKIQILKSALDKARKNGNDSLALILEQQLLQAIENIEL